MIAQLPPIARNAFVESVRQPIYFIIVTLCGVLMFFTTWTSAFSMGYSTSAEVSGDNKLLLDVGAANVFVCTILLAAFTATSVISREIEKRTVLTVVSKPVARPTLVIGKYLGVAGSLVVAAFIMLLFLQLAIRHQVMTTARDHVDGPVMLFSSIAVVLSIGLGAWCNYFYGWSFPQTATLLMAPLMLLAYVGVLFVGKEWEFQPIGADFKPQITLACLALLLSQPVVAAIATASSARLGQVMTIVVSAGVFVFGLFSNYLIGRHAYQNEFIAIVAEADPLTGSDEDFDDLADTFRVRFELEPRTRLRLGDTFHYGPSPSGAGLVTEGLPAFQGDVSDPDQLFDEEVAPTLVVTDVGPKEATVVLAGREPAPLLRPPVPGDYVFPRSTTIHPLAVIVWGVVPNPQFFWLIDAVTQNQPIPGNHILLLAVYAGFQTAVFLSLAIILFQDREVG